MLLYYVHQREPLKDLAKSILSLGINTVDSFDVHSDIVALKTELDEVAKKHNRVASDFSGLGSGFRLYYSYLNVSYGT